MSALTWVELSQHDFSLSNYQFVDQKMLLLLVTVYIDCSSVCVYISYLLVINNFKKFVQWKFKASLLAIDNLFITAKIPGVKTVFMLDTRETASSLV